MVETLKLIHFFLTSYLEWSFSKEALAPNQRLFIFFHTDEIQLESFSYTSHHDAVIVMFLTTGFLVIQFLFLSTVFATVDFNEVEGDHTYYKSALLDDCSYVFFASAPRNLQFSIDGDQSEHEEVHESFGFGRQMRRTDMRLVTKTIFIRTFLSLILLLHQNIIMMLLIWV